MGIADSIAGAIGACVLNRKNVRAEPGDENASLDHRFSAPSVDGRKRCENASVDAELFIRFRGTKNGGFQKRISVDRALYLKLSNVNIKTLHFQIISLFINTK